MNKYDEKLLELVPEGGTIHDLLRSPVRSRLFHFVSILLDNIPRTMDGLSVKGAYYLHINDEADKASLIHIDNNLNASRDNVTKNVEKSASKNSFVFEGNKYKLYRKVR